MMVMSQQHARNVYLVDMLLSKLLPLVASVHVVGYKRWAVKQIVTAQKQVPSLVRVHLLLSSLQKDGMQQIVQLMAV